MCFVDVPWKTSLSPRSGWEWGGGNVEEAEGGEGVETGIGL